MSGSGKLIFGGKFPSGTMMAKNKEQVQEQILSRIITDEQVLRQKSEPVSIEDIKALGLDEVLKKAVRLGWTQGAAISAIQLGIPIQFAYYDFDIPELVPGLKKLGDGFVSEENGTIRALNPKKDITNLHFGPTFLLNPFIKPGTAKNLVRVPSEGCLSMPNKRFSTWRFNEVTVCNAWHDGKNPIKGSLTEIHATGFLAWMLQHELDHMNGILCSDRCDIERNGPCVCGSKKKAKKCCLKDAAI